MSRHCVHWSSIAETVAPNGVAKRSLAGTKVSLVTVRIPAGTTG